MIGAPQASNFAAMVVNWNDDIPQAITIDFALIGAATSINQACTVRDLWTNQNYGRFVGFIDSPMINPHDNVAYSITCDTTL